jgi:hypothetical protein
MCPTDATAPAGSEQPPPKKRRFFEDPPAPSSSSGGAATTAAASVPIPAYYAPATAMGEGGKVYIGVLSDGPYRGYEDEDFPGILGGESDARPLLSSSPRSPFLTL